MAQASSSSGPLYPVNGFDVATLTGATVVIPAVSLGNVPQLTADLLVTSLGLRRVAFLGRGDTVAPFAGRGEDGIVTGGLELYGNEGKVFVLMQRAPTLKSKKDAHIELIASLVKTYGVGLALVLASLDAANQDDAQLLTPHQAVLPPGAVANPVLERLAHLPALKLTLETTPHHHPSPHASSSSSLARPRAASTVYPPFLPGAGLTRRVLGALADTAVPSGAVTAWVVEGDNRGDAHALAGVALQILGVGETDIVEPASWAGLFGPGQGWSGGSGMDAEIYG